MRQWYRKFKRKYRLMHVLIMAVAIVMFWWGVWGVLDLTLSEENPIPVYALGILIAFFLLYIDDFHLGELK